MQMTNSNTTIHTLSADAILANHFEAIYEDIGELGTRAALTEAIGAHIENFSPRGIDTVSGIPSAAEISEDLTMLEEMVDQIKGRITQVRGMI
jgi:hypothetical protein